MNENTLKITISTPFKTVYEGEGLSLIAPGELGYMGILVNHAPIISNLGPGKITIRETSGNVKLLTSKEKGVIEVFQNNVNILFDSLESKER